jgi:6-phosphogluconolactonase
MSDSIREMTAVPSRRSVLGGVAAVAAVPLLARRPSGAATGRAGGRQLVFFSTWQGTQIYGAWFDPSRGTLSALGPVGEADSGWATMHPTKQVLYVAGGGQGGIAYEYTIDPVTGALTRSGNGIATDDGRTGGGGLAYLGVYEPSATLLVANYEAGLAATLPIATDGSLGSPVSVVQDSGSGPNARQAGPHVHHIAIDPSGRFALIADFGADRVFIHRFDRATGTMSQQGTAYTTAAGSGPRRVLFHPGGRVAYLLNELTADIEVLSWDPRAGRLAKLQDVPTDTPGFAGTKSAAELGMSRDGRFVYVSNRGQEALVVYAVDRRSGLLAPIQRISCGGETPWSFSIHANGRWLLVANEVSNSVNVFSIDERSGSLANTGISLEVPNPDCITFGHLP